MDDLEQVYDSFDDEPNDLHSDWSETHYRVTGDLWAHVVGKLRQDWQIVGPGAYVFLMFALDHKKDEVLLELGYGPGEVDLTFVQLPFDPGCSLETNLLYWLAGLR